MKIRALLFICCTTILVSAVEAKIKEDKGTPKQIVHIKKMDKRVSELMADRVNTVSYTHLTLPTNSRV